jgi:hypothetical protein
MVSVTLNEYGTRVAKTGRLSASGGIHGAAVARDHHVSHSFSLGGRSIRGMHQQSPPSIAPGDDCPKSQLIDSMASMQGAATAPLDSVPGMLPILVTKPHGCDIVQPNRRLGMRTPEQVNSFVSQLMGKAMPSVAIMGHPGRLRRELVKWSLVSKEPHPAQEPHLTLPVGILIGMSHVVARRRTEDTVSFTLFYIAHPRLPRPHQIAMRLHDFSRPIT